MLCVETIGKIRRRCLIYQDAISGIARDLGLARNTVKKALRTGAEPFEYRRKRQPRPQLGPYLKLLDEWLEAEARLPERERRGAQRLYEALQLVGYGGAIDSVRRHLKRHRELTKPVSAFIPQVFAPGEAYQFDWSHEKVELGGAVQVLKVAHLRLCHSRAFHVAPFDGFHERVCRVSSTALEHKPGALRNIAPFKDWNLPGAMTRVRERLAKHLINRLRRVCHVEPAKLRRPAFCAKLVSGLSTFALEHSCHDDMVTQRRERSGTTSADADAAANNQHRARVCLPASVSPEHEHSRLPQALRAVARRAPPTPSDQRHAICG
jgi:hypothetical protein